MQQIKTRKQVENIGVYVPGKPIEEVKRELGLTRIVKLASNENPFGYSDLARQAIIAEMQQINFYPEGMAPALAEKLSQRLGLDKDQFIFGNGSDEIIQMLTRTYISSGDEAIMANITFPRYETNVLIEGGTPITVPLVDGVHDLKAMQEAITNMTKMIFVCNPNNPTGTIVKDLRAFIESIPSHILVVVDEAYYEYVDAADYLETVPLLPSYPNLIILRTFSKLYGLAALRIGYGMMHPTIVKQLIKVKEPFNTNRLAQAAALASLDDDAFLQSCRDENEQGRLYLQKEVEKMGLSYFPSHTNFVMVHLQRSGDEVFKGLLKQGIIVRSGGLLGYPETIRVTIGTQEESELFIQALQHVMESKG